MARKPRQAPFRQRTSINVSVNLWRRFKATLTLEGQDMSPILEAFIEDYLQHHEEAAREAAHRSQEERHD